MPLRRRERYEFYNKCRTACVFSVYEFFCSEISVSERKLCDLKHSEDLIDLFATCMVVFPFREATYSETRDLGQQQTNYTMTILFFFFFSIREDNTSICTLAEAQNRFQKTTAEQVMKTKFRLKQFGAAP